MGIWTETPTRMMIPNVVDWIVWMDAFDVLEPYLVEKEIIECPTHFA